MARASAGALRPALTFLIALLAAIACPALAQVPAGGGGQAPAGGIAPAPQARMSNWVVTPSLKLSETYTDNVFLAPDGFQQSDWITQVIPGISVTGNTPRLRLDASYTPEILYHAQTEREDKVFHRGYAIGTLEVAEALLFLEAGARVDQYDISVRGPLTISNVNITGNRATAATTYVSPYLRRDFGSAVRGEARFTYSAWESDDTQATLPDNTARRVFLQLANTPAYTLFTWDVTYSGERIEYDTRQETTSEELTASGKRRISSTVSLLGLAGYERYDTGLQTLEDPRWSAGLEWTPLPRTLLAVTAGRRLDDKAYSFQFSHRTRLSNWNVSYAEDVTTAREQFFVPASQSTAAALEPMFQAQYPDPAARQRAVQEFVARTGLPPSLGAPVNFFSDQLFVQKRWLASAGLQGVRNTLVGTAFWESRDAVPGATSPVGDFAASESVRTSGGSLAWGLRLTARATGNFVAGYTRSKFLDTGQVNDYAFFQVGLTRQFQPRVSGSLHYRLQDQASTQVGAAEYTENAVVAALLVTF